MYLLIKNWEKAQKALGSNITRKEGDKLYCKSLAYMKRMAQQCPEGLELVNPNENKESSSKAGVKSNKLYGQKSKMKTKKNRE